ncbi:MAG: hypothetical protein ACLQGJ_12850 [Candidatus Dormibacteria bacterium]
MLGGLPNVGTVIDVASPGPITLTGDNSYSGGTVLASGAQTGQVAISGSSPLGSGPVTIEQGATLTGTGTIGDLASAGTLAPGDGAGQTGVLSAGSLTLSSGSTFTTELDSASSFDAVNAGGAVNISGATLDVTLGPGYQPAPGTSFTIIRNRSGQPIDGTFAGLPEGASLLVDGTPFSITYQGNDEDDVVISTVQPSTPTPAPTVTPFPVPSPSRTQAPTLTPVAAPTPAPTPTPVVASPTSASGGTSPAVLVIGIAGVLLILVGLSLAVPGPIRRRFAAWHRGRG